MIISRNVLNHEPTHFLCMDICKNKKLEIYLPHVNTFTNVFFLEEKLFAHLCLMLHVNFATEIAMFCYSFTVSLPLHLFVLPLLFLFGVIPASFG